MQIMGLNFQPKEFTILFFQNSVYAIRTNLKDIFVARIRLHNYTPLLYSSLTIYLSYIPVDGGVGATSSFDAPFSISDSL